MSPLDHIRIFVVVLVRSSVLFSKLYRVFFVLISRFHRPILFIPPSPSCWKTSLCRRHRLKRRRRPRATHNGNYWRQMAVMPCNKKSLGDSYSPRASQSMTMAGSLWCSSNPSSSVSTGMRMVTAIIGYLCDNIQSSPCPDLTEESWSAGRTETLEFIFKSQHLPSAMLGRISKCHFRLTRDLKHPLRPVFIEVTNTLTPYSIHRFMITPQFAQYKRTCGTMGMRIQGGGFVIK